jgi:hypothetical protein
MILQLLFINELKSYIVVMEIYCLNFVELNGNLKEVIMKKKPRGSSRTPVL